MPGPHPARWRIARRGGPPRLAAPTLAAAAAAAAAVAAAVLTACSANPQSHVATSATSVRSPTVASAASVPMTVIRSGRSAMEIVPVTIDGHGPYRFMLDTGSSVSSVTSQLAAMLHLPRTGAKAVIKGVVGSQKVPVVAIAGWKVGNTVLTPAKVAVLGSASGPNPVLGLLGSDELSRFGSVTEDFQDHQLLLAPP